MQSQPTTAKLNEKTEICDFVAMSKSLGPLNSITTGSISTVYLEGLDKAMKSNTTDEGTVIYSIELSSKQQLVNQLFAWMECKWSQ